MEYSITFLEKDFKRLVEDLFSDCRSEHAAYLLGNFSKTNEDLRFLVTDIIPIRREDIEEASELHMKIKSISYVRVIKKARIENEGLFFVHSHPIGPNNYSTQDDSEELQFFNTVYSRIPDAFHGSIVFSKPNKYSARLWQPDGSHVPISLIRVIGDRFQFISNDLEGNPFPEYFDRQIRAFGKEIQTTLNKLKIGIVGVGGTGSAIAEQLIRLGVGELHIFDYDNFEKTNVNRVYGSRVSDEGKNKVDIIERLANDIGLGTRIKKINKSITYKSSLNELKKCDIIFGCTDDQWGRMILNNIAIFYYIPIIDMGVKIDSENAKIKSIQGRTTVLLPNNACLFCRQTINSGTISGEILSATNPGEADLLRDEGYIPELQDSAPAVIPFTTIVASTSIIELLHRLTGFLGDARHTSEIINLFDLEKIGKNSKPQNKECFCGEKSKIGRGDVEPNLLEINWRDED